MTALAFPTPRPRCHGLTPLGFPGRDGRWEATGRRSGACVAPVSRGPRLGWRPRGLCRGPRCSEAGGEVRGAAAAGSALGAATRGSCVRSGWVVAPVLARPGLAWERPRARVVELGREEPQHPPGLEARLPATYDVSHYLRFFLFFFFLVFLRTGMWMFVTSARTADPWQSRDGSPGLLSSVPFSLLARRAVSGSVLVTSGSCVFAQMWRSRCGGAQGGSGKF